MSRTYLLNLSKLCVVLTGFDHCISPFWAVRVISYNIHLTFPLPAMLFFYLVSISLVCHKFFFSSLSMYHSSDAASSYLVQRVLICLSCMLLVSLHHSVLWDYLCSFFFCVSGLHFHTFLNDYISIASSFDFIYCFFF